MQPIQDRIYYNQQTQTWYLYIEKRCYSYCESQPSLGRGGMGEVFLGRDCATGERVAIKRVKSEYENYPEIRSRARMEAKLAFRHPNLVEMFGCAESISGRGPLFLISRFVSGENINSYISKTLVGMASEIRQRKIVEMLYPVLNALDYIHSSGIVHLDIKPSNIMVEGGKNIRLMDLGIAMSNNRTRLQNNVGEYNPSYSTHSSSGLMGTPKYAAPEQYGENLGYGQINATTDIYEFGVTLYELLAGVNPFISTSIDESLNKHVKLELPQSPFISKRLLKTLRKATSPNQSERHQSIKELRSDLEKTINAPKSLLSRIFNIFS